MTKRLILILCVLAGLVSCREDTLSKDPIFLSFSHDTVFFDTVFTSTGSSTHRIMVYNRNKNALNISRISMQSGQYFHINADGENDMSRLRDITVRGGDSLFLFVRVNIDPQDKNSPVLVEDDITFSVSDRLQSIHLQAYGQNVERMRDPSGLIVKENLTLTNEKPYVIYDTLAVKGLLTIQAGAMLYMHTGAMLCAYGDVVANGTREAPIVVRGDRTDRLFDSVPYRVASGQWNGIYLLHDQAETCPTYQMNYVEILSGTVGLYAQSTSVSPRPMLTFSNGRIHNHSMYGMILQNIDAEVVNTEISNCASYCVYLSGGKQRFIHNTIASYFGYPYTNINIHNQFSRDDVAAVYINNINKETASTEATFKNCIITGARKSNLLVATPLAQHYGGAVEGNYLRADSLPTAFAQHNVYATPTDTVFRNIYYHVGEYKYFDFRLDSVSPARGIGDSLTAVTYPIDRLGHKRKAHPDAGCYEYE